MMLDDNLEKYLEFLFQKNSYFEKKKFITLNYLKNILKNNILRYLENSPLIIRKYLEKILKYYHII